MSFLQSPSPPNRSTPHLSYLDPPFPGDQSRHWGVMRPVALDLLLPSTPRTFDVLILRWTENGPKNGPKTGWNRSGPCYFSSISWKCVVDFGGLFPSFAKERTYTHHQPPKFVSLQMLSFGSIIKSSVSQRFKNHSGPVLALSFKDYRQKNTRLMWLKQRGLFFVRIRPWGYGLWIRRESLAANKPLGRVIVVVNVCLTQDLFSEPVPKG